MANQDTHQLQNSFTQEMQNTCTTKKDRYEDSEILKSVLD